MLSDAFCADDTGRTQPLDPLAASAVSLPTEDVQTLLDLLRTITEGHTSPSDNTVNPSHIFSKCRFDSNDSDGARSPIAIPSEPRTDLVLNNDDLHSVPQLLASCETDSDTESDGSEDAEVLEAEDIIRHFRRGNDIKYL